MNEKYGIVTRLQAENADLREKLETAEKKSTEQDEIIRAAFDNLSITLLEAERLRGALKQIETCAATGEPIGGDKNGQALDKIFDITSSVLIVPPSEYAREVRDFLAEMKAARVCPDDDAVVCTHFEQLARRAGALLAQMGEK
jgi:hypothetical protein